MNVATMSAVLGAETEPAFLPGVSCLCNHKDYMLMWIFDHAYYMIAVH